MIKIKLKGPNRLTKEEYIAQFEPRIKDIPYTAPIYDQIRTVKRYPKIVGCLRTDDEQRIRMIFKKNNQEGWLIKVRNKKIYACICYMQGLSRANISFGACMDYMDGRRAFDYAEEEHNDKQQDINNLPNVKVKR